MDKYKYNEVTTFKDVNGRLLVVGDTVSIIIGNIRHTGNTAPRGERLVCQDMSDTRIDIKEDTIFIIL
jgi:hypothetical protein